MQSSELDRGTTAGVLFPAHWVFRRDPDATVAVFPSDHFVLEEATFMEHVVRVGAWVNEHPPPRRPGGGAGGQ
jgi:mannose-1-phosphate guanylyltransferase